MKYAICNETFQDWPFERAMAFARECGYTGLEIAPFTMAENIRQVSTARRAEVRRQAKAADLEIIGLHWLLAKTSGYHLTSADESVRRATSEYLMDLARCCRELGGWVLVFGSPLQRNLMPGVSHEQGMRYAAEVIRAAMPVIERENVTLAVEPLGPADGNFLLTAADGARLVDMVGSPNCRMHLDCKAMASEPRPVAETIRRHASYMVHFHANDPNRLGPGMGDLDFKPIFQALRDVKYDGWVSVEVFDYTPGIERLARESIDNMRAAVGKVK